MKLIKKRDLSPIYWSGGKTTELYIYPEEGSYSSLEFSFRLSKASIEIHHSVFTKLPQVKRELMVLTGELTLFHDHKYSIKLQPFQSDKFNGSWDTKSTGLAEDFNLMMLGETEGHLEHLSSDKHGKVMIDLDCDIIAVFCASGSTTINSEKLIAEDLAIIEQNKKQIILDLDQNTNLIIARIWLNN